MKTLDQLLRSLDREDVIEVTLISGNPPYARVGAALEPLDDDPWTTEALIEALVGFGGSRHVEDLSPTPKHWTSRVTGLGVIAVAALQREDAEVQARFTLSRRDGRSIPAPATGPLAPPVVAASRPPPGPPPPPPPPRPAPPPPPPPPPPRAAPPPPAPPPPPASAPRPEAPPPPRPRFASHAPGLRIDTPTQRHVPTPLELAHDDLPALVVVPVAPVPEEPLELEELAPTPPPSPSAPSELVPAVPPIPPPRSPVPAPPPPPAPGIGTLLANARDAGASDLHIIAGRPPLYRVAGELRQNGQLVESGRVERMVMPLIPPHLQELLAERGSCDFALSHAEGRFRVNVCRQLGGLKACLRLVPSELPTVEGLRLHAGIAPAAQHPQGLIVFTGPMGHGKTTTLTAVIDRINRTTMHHIITVEDPIEHLHPRGRALMSQREIGTHTRSFASALLAAMREDPDVIVVGELRDRDTVRMALTLSETGHLVLATMNAPSAARTIDRMIDMFPAVDQPEVRLTLAASLRLIVSQRLVPTKQRERMHAAFEILPGSLPLAALIREDKIAQIPSLRERGKALGIVGLDESLADLVADQRVTLEDAKAVAVAPEDLETLVSASRGARS